METKTATQALENIGNMAQEMEDRYEKQIDLLNFLEDACKMAEKYLLENRELKTENEDLVQKAGELILEAREARRTFTALQISVSILIFLYGMMYGKYSR